MTSSLSLSLTDTLRDFVDSRVGNGGPYATAEEYLSDLIRRDMESREVVAHVAEGLVDLAQGRFSDKSIEDIMVEED